MTTPAAKPETRTLAQQAYALLREDILSGGLEPGAWLRIDGLRARYEIGPTPIREALSRLSSEGFVVAEENRGFRIPPVTLANLRDITDQRKLVECAALASAIRRGDEDFESGVVAAYHRLSRMDEKLADFSPAVLVEWEARHRDYHRALILGAASPWLERFQELLYDQADRYRRLYLPRTGVPPHVLSDHRRIMELVLARDADAACALLAEHIEKVYDVACRSDYFRTLEDGAGKTDTE